MPRTWLVLVISHGRFPLPDVATAGRVRPGVAGLYLGVLQSVSTVQFIILGLLPVISKVVWD